MSVTTTAEDFWATNKAENFGRDRRVTDGNRLVVSWQGPSGQRAAQLGGRGRQGRMGRGKPGGRECQEIWVGD